MLMLQIFQNGKVARTNSTIFLILHFKVFYNLYSFFIGLTKFTQMFKKSELYGFNKCMMYMCSISGSTSLENIECSKDVETAKVGEQGVLISDNGISTLLKFASPKGELIENYRITP